MEIVAVPPIRTGSLLWQPRTGAWALTVVAKLTFLLVPGEAAIAEDQDDVSEHDQHWNDDETRSLYAAGDLAPRKARADVTLVGNAFAPGGEPVRSLAARLSVGTIDKRVEIWGERSFSRDGVLREATRFSRMPLRYERAAGGPGTANPVGVRTGASAQADGGGAVILPNLQPVGGAPARRTDGMEPIGFGPLPASFPSRGERLGRHAAAVASLADAPLPEDFDFAYFNVAPADQQTAALKEDERIVLQNLHREHATLRTSLPGARPRAFMERDGAAREVSLRCDALWIDTDRAVCTVVWRGEIPLAAPEERGRVLVGLEARGAHLRYEDLIEQKRSAPGPVPPAPIPPPPAPVRAPPMLGSVPLGAPPLVAMPPSIVSATPVPPPVVDRSADDDIEEAPITPNIPADPRTLPGSTASTARMPVFQPAAALPFLRDVPAKAGLADPQRLPAPAGDSPRLPPVTPAPDRKERPRTSTLINPTQEAIANQGPAWLRPAPAASPPPAPRPAMGSSPAFLGAAARSPQAPAAPRFGGAEPVDLVWHDRAAVGRVRAAFLDPGQGPAGAEGDPDRIASDFAVALASAPRATAALIDEAMTAPTSDGRFRAPLMVVPGELRFTFDAIEALRLTVSAALPFAPGDARVREAVDLARELLATPWLAPLSTAAEGLTQRVQEAFAQGGRPPAYLGGVVDRALLERRAYQRRTVLGAERIRATISLPGAEAPRPVYLPAEAAASLPMFPAFDARLLVEVHPPQDHAEASPVALKALAIGRVVPRRGG
jgi:hypothetical protein